LTVAYLKPGTAGKYLFMPTGLDGYELEFDALTSSSFGREQEAVLVNENPKGCNQYTGPGCGVRGNDISQEYASKSHVQQMDRRVRAIFARSKLIVVDRLDGVFDRGETNLETGEVKITKLTADEAGRFYKGDRDKYAIQAAMVPIHEAYHASGSVSEKARTMQVEAIEEATTEVLARDYMKSNFGLKHKLIPDKPDHHFGGYQKLIQAGVRSLAKETGQNFEAAAQQFTTASRLWRVRPRTSDYRQALFSYFDDLGVSRESGIRITQAMSNAFHGRGSNKATVNTRFAFQTSAEQTEAFRKWLANEVELQMFGTLEEQIKDAWWRGYIEEGYKQGAGRAFDDTKKPYAKGYAQDESTSDFYRGSKEQFLRSAFAQPVSVDKVKLLAGRVYTDIKGVTDIVATKVQRSLTDGIIQGKSPREVGREMNDVLDAYKNQATTVARSETIRAHAEGQLDAMEKLGVEDVGVAVEWSTSGMGVTALGNPSPCELCAPLSGIVMKVSEARGLIPRHPNCMCSLVPANVGEDTSGQLRSAASIKGAFRKSIKAEIPKGSKRTIAQQKAKSSWKGAGKTIGKKRPRGMVGNLSTHYSNLSPAESQSFIKGSQLLQQQLALTMLDLALNG
jgi:hypothetical protein